MHPETEQLTSGKKLVVFGLIAAGIFNFCCCTCFSYVAVDSEWGKVKSGAELRSREMQILARVDMPQAGEGIVAFWDPLPLNDTRDLVVITDQRIIRYFPDATVEIALADVVSVDAERTQSNNWLFEIESADGTNISVENDTFDEPNRFGTLLAKALSEAGNPIDFKIPKDN